MRTLTFPIPVKGSAGGDPVEYLFRKVDCRKELREPAAELIFGCPPLLSKCIQFSRSDYPYTSYVLSYRDDPNPPSHEIRRRIHADCLRFLAGGFAKEHLVALGVDHGDHEHGLLLRHLADPSWPRFQPYFHAVDRKVFSTFQLLVNRRYGLAAPEDPRKHQLLSLAGKHFKDEHIKILMRLRELLKTYWELKTIRNHRDFLGLLRRQGYGPVFVPHPHAAEDTPQRGWIEMKYSDSERPLLLKGPPCSPNFTRKAYDLERAQVHAQYQAFLKDPYPLWERFLEAVRRRRERNQKRLAAFMDDATPEDFFGFSDLHPDHYLKLQVSMDIA